MNEKRNAYEKAIEGPVVAERGARVLLEVKGRDRAAWLHNLTTNQVKTLSVGEGNYALALSVQGRILFDLNLWIRADSIWIDLDGRFAEIARKHFAKYTITEDVSLQDRSGEFSRLALMGRRSGELLAKLGISNATALASLAHSKFDWQGSEIVVVRHDFCGPMGFELFIPASAADAFQNALFQGEFGLSVNRVSMDVVETLRIEAGIPWPGAEITDEYLPAETRQLERAVSYQKGCYLGQEVVERMRSRQVVARQLVGLRFASNELPAARSAIQTAMGENIGVVTSVAQSPSLQCGIGLGYVKTAQAAANSSVTVASPAGPIPATIAALPFVDFSKKL